MGCVVDFNKGTIIKRLISNVLLFASVALFAIEIFVNPLPDEFKEELVPEPGFPAPGAVVKFRVCEAVEVLLMYNCKEPVSELPYALAV